MSIFMLQEEAYYRMEKQLLLTVALIFQSLVPTTLKAQLSVDLRGQVL